MMSEENGYATASEVFEKGVQRRYTTETVMGFKFRIQSMDARQHEQFVRDNRGKDGDLSSNRRLLVECVVGEDNKPMFNAGDMPRLEKLDTTLVMGVAKACAEHCGLTEEEPEKN